MITFKELGRHGRLGNQMFQIASCIGIALDNNMKYIFPEWSYNRYLKKEIPTLLRIEHDTHYDDKTFIWHEIPLTKDKINNLHGFYQTEKYFKKQGKLIKEYFTLKDDYLERIKDVFPKGQTISIHIRRGDYVQKKIYNPIPTIGFYKRAVELIEEKNEEVKFKVLVFSDDLLWCKQNLPQEWSCFTTGDDVLDLFAMSMCTHNVIANSTYSWWAAWLNKNPNKLVYYPSKWFGPGLSENPKDIPCPEWTELNSEIS